MDQPPIDRTDTARANDDRALIDEMAEEAGGSGGQASMSGGRVATDVASRDELKEAGEPGRTRPTGQDDATTLKPGRADNEGANG